MTVKFDAQGLVPAIAQDHLTGQIRMLAWMNRQALTQTLDTGFATFYSRSRRQLWVKGETSGNRLRVKQVRLDCDGDTLLLLVEPAGPSCHTGRPSCFFQVLDQAAEPTQADNDTPFMSTLEVELESRKRETAGRSYTRSLLDGGAPKISAKLTEEAAELGQALQQESDERVASEAADLIYHALVGLRLREVPWRSVIEVLEQRFGISGHAEKASRTGKLDD